MTAPGMAKQVDGAQTQPFDKSDHIVHMLRHFELAALAVPLLGEIMTEARDD